MGDPLGVNNSSRYPSIVIHTGREGAKMWEKVWREEYQKHNQHMAEEKPLIPVIVTSDDDGHNYVIPAEQIGAFRTLLEQGEALDDYKDFEEAFDQYRTGGGINNVKLYARI